MYVYLGFYVDWCNDFGGRDEDTVSAIFSTLFAMTGEKHIAAISFLAT